MTTPVFVLMASIVAFMVVGTAVVGSIYTSNRERHRDMLMRTMSWYPVNLFFMGGLALGRTFFTLSFVWVSLRALGELFNADREPLPRPLWAVCGGASLLHYALMFGGAWWAGLILLPIVSVCVLPGVVLWREGSEGFVARAGSLGFYLLLGGWTLGMIPLVCWLPADLGPHGWIGALMFLLTVTQGNDLFQYIWGKVLGKTPMAPVTSPGKTWEGALGGALTMTAIGSLLGEFITPLGWAWGGVASLGLCVGGVLGDLVVSAVKRDMGVKDLGALLPGFGGVLDRVDSLTLNSPVFVAVILATRVASGGS